MPQEPGRLHPGDKVGVFVCSSPVKEDLRTRGLEQIRNMGLIPVEAPDILSGHHFLAKEPHQVLADIQAFFSDPEIKALWAARGGYGANLLLPLLSSLDIPGPRIVIGSSDVSYLLWHLLDRRDMVVFYGPMAYSTLAEKRDNRDNLIQVLSGAYSGLQIPGQVLKEGRVKAPVTGGCLTNLVSLIGTPYFPRVEGRILLLEDVGERPYRLDRMFWQLLESGIFQKVKGLLLGQFPQCFKDEAEKAHLLGRLLTYLGKSDIPVIYDLPFGHGHNLHTLPLGLTVLIDTPAFPGLSLGTA